MIKQVYVYPRSGLTPRLSSGEVCTAEGAWSPLDRHLREMIRDQDVTVGDPPTDAVKNNIKKGAKA